MVGIVIVSHSAKLAEGVYELADQMVQGRVPMATAGGIDDAEQPIGTDAMKVLEAIQAVYSDDGVVILMDLGSALLSAEMALEFLDSEQRENVYLSSAALVEGTMAAAVQASIGGTPQQVIAESKGALAIKTDQLGETAAGESPAVETAVSGPAGAAEELLLDVPNRLGLHARPAALFVARAGEFQADIRVFKGERQANAKSINQVAMLGARQGDELRIAAVGEDAAAALAALQDLADNNFGDVDEEQGPTVSAGVPIPSAGEDSLMGIPVSPGIAIGAAVLYKPSLPEIERYPAADAQGEWERLQEAIAEAIRELALIQSRAVEQVGQSEAAIFEAHALMLGDPELTETARELLFDEQINAEAAWQQTISSTAEGYRAIDNEYMQARAADVEDAGHRVLRHLMALEPPAMDFSAPSILVAADLSPSDTAQLDPSRVLGICTELGGATSHSAILARGLGIPAIVGLGSRLWSLQDGQLIAMDGQAGQLWLHPAESELAQLGEQQARWQEAQEKARQESKQAAVTLDGRAIEVAANIGGPNDVPLALEYGAEGVGLFRTEFLFLDRRWHRQKKNSMRLIDEPPMGWESGP